MGGMTDSGTPLHKVIKNIFGRKVFKIDTGDSRDAVLVRDLQEALGQARRAMVEKPIQSKRPNEVGNYIEPYVLAALNQMPGYRAEKPKTQSGKGQSTGYPDILVTDMHQRASYLECKTSTEKRKQQGMRTFYLSEPRSRETAKVTLDARHLLALFTMKEESQKYTPTGVSLIDIYALPCNLKKNGIRITSGCCNSRYGKGGRKDVTRWRWL